MAINGLENCQNNGERSYSWLHKSNKPMSPTACRVQKRHQKKC